MSLKRRIERLEGGGERRPVVPLVMIEGDRVTFWGKEMTRREYEAYKKEHASEYEAARQAGVVTALVIYSPEEGPDELPGKGSTIQLPDNGRPARRPPN